jgi:hypothetical protein
MLLEQTCEGPAVMNAVQVELDKVISGPNISELEEERVELLLL